MNTVVAEQISCWNRRCVSPQLPADVALIFFLDLHSFVMWLRQNIYTSMREGGTTTCGIFAVFLFSEACHLKDQLRIYHSTKRKTARDLILRAATLAESI